MSDTGELRELLKKRWNLIVTMAGAVFTVAGTLIALAAYIGDKVIEAVERNNIAIQTNTAAIAEKSRIAETRLSAIEKRLEDVSILRDRFIDDLARRAQAYDEQVIRNKETPHQ